MTDAKKIKIVFYTNGVLLNKKLNKILSYIDWLNFPIEAYNSKLNDEIRPGFSKQLELIIKLIKIVRQKYPQVKIKIGTVVTQKNINGLEKIAKVIKNNNICPDVWKLYEFGPRRKGKINKNIFFINTAKFLSEAKKAKIILDKICEQSIVVIKLFKEFDKADLVMNPNGDAVCLIKGKDKIIGSFSKGFDKLVKEWPKYINLKQLINHHNLTYTDILNHEK